MAKTTRDPMTYEEQQLMAIYNLNNDAGSRQGLIAVLADMRKDIDSSDPDEQELLTYTDAALRHLGEMSDDEFAALDLTVDFPE